MGVAVGDRDARMPERIAHGRHYRVAFECMRGVRMAEKVRGRTYIPKQSGKIAKTFRVHESTISRLAAAREDLKP